MIGHMDRERLARRHRRIARDGGTDRHGSTSTLGMGGFVILRRPVSIALPDNYVFSRARQGRSHLTSS